MTAFVNEQKNPRITGTEKKLAAFSTLLDSWKQQYDNPPSAQFSFSLNEKNKLTLGDAVICDIENVRAGGASYDYEHLYLDAFTPGWFYRVKIVWGFDETVYVDEVALVMYQADQK